MARGLVTPFIAFRYVLSTQHGSLISFISRLSMLGLVLGVALLIVVFSVMNGFDRELRNRILKVVPQVTLYALDELRDWQSLSEQLLAVDGVRAVAPYIGFQGLLVNGSRVETVLGFGVEPRLEAKVSSLPEYVLRGDLHRLAERRDALAISESLATLLAVDLGDTVMLMVPESGQGSDLTPRLTSVEIAAVYSTGTEVDNLLVLGSLQGIADLMRMSGRVEGVRLKIDDLFDAPRLAQRLRLALAGQFLVGDWTRSYGNLYQAIQLSRRLVGMLVFLIIAVAVFNVVSTLVLIVDEKRGDIAILRTLGASASQVMATFMLLGGLIGFVGSGIGAVVGVLVSLVVGDALEWFEALSGADLLRSDVYPVSYLPAALQLSDIGTVTAVAMGMSLLATIYPAWRAARLYPADVLRYE